jgi:hypothetical protein
MSNGNGNGNGNGKRPDGLTTPWLAVRLGVQSARIDAMRRAGDLLGVPVRGTHVHLYPAWQFDRDGKPLADVQRLIRLARASGVDEQRLVHILGMRAGLTGSRRVVDELRGGNDEPAVRAIAAASNGGASQ